MDIIQQFADKMKDIDRRVTALEQGQPPEPTPEPSKVAYGTAVNHRFFNGEEDNPEYFTRLKELFTWGVIENCGKMKSVHPEKDRYFWKDIDAVLAWFNANGMKLKYHTLVWDKNVPQWYWDLPEDQKRGALQRHIRTIVSHYKGLFPIYDVVNEPIGAKSYSTFMGIKTWFDNTVANCFKWAREADPDATLLINENNIIVDEKKRKLYIDLIDKIINNKQAPVDGIGLQGHFGKELPSNEQIISVLDEMAQFNLPLYISEFDMVPTTDEYQAEAYKRAYEVFSSHKAVKQVFMWGFWDSAHWRPGAGLFDRDFNPKPVYHALKDILV